jgi:hypothetical protein
VKASGGIADTESETGTVELIEDAKKESKLRPTP